MTQARLNHCMLLHVSRNKTDELNNVEIAKEFIGRNERRRNYLSNNLCIIFMINSHVHELDSTAIIEYNVVIIMKYMHI